MSIAARLLGTGRIQNRFQDAIPPSVLMWTFVIIAEVVPYNKKYYIYKMNKRKLRNEKDMYIYEGHMGELYTSDEPLDYEDLYCEECGDSDWLVGYAATKEEAWNLLKDDTDINGSGGWEYSYVQEFLK